MLGLLYAFYGDDFTGSTDVLEQLAAGGLRAVLFPGAPTAQQLSRFPDVQASGIAGESRSKSPEWMTENLPNIFRTLRSLGAPVNHYKVCSTFDSSPRSGSIGRALELGRAVFHPRYVPIVVGAPHLRRYVAFGQLFAAAPDGRIYRIDRHPMSHHPVTPMREADLRLHLARQTSLPIGLVDHLSLRAGSAAHDLGEQLGNGSDAVLFDTLDEADLSGVGKLLWSDCRRQPLFAAGSSGLTVAMLREWRQEGIVSAKQAVPAVELAEPLLVVSGSCSVATERQIRWALDHGYHGIALNVAELLRSGAAAFRAAAASLAAGRHTILYTALGTPEEMGPHQELGFALGVLLRELLTRTAVRRVVVCGGDTSSHAIQQLGLYALTWSANLQPGAPLCRAHADGELDGIELVLKGGQVGTDDFFDVVRSGGPR